MARRRRAAAPGADRVAELEAVLRRGTGIDWMDVILASAEGAARVEPAPWPDHAWWDDLVHEWADLTGTNRNDAWIHWLPCM